MNSLNIVGLCLDLVGVALLGADLVRIQRKLRADARERLTTLNDVFDGRENLERWMDDLAKSADWREYQWEEGLTVSMSGTFDRMAAQETIREITGQISELGSDIGKLAQLQIASANADHKTAGHSLVYSYLGLALIVVGFTFQVVSQL